MKRHLITWAAIALLATPLAAQDLNYAEVVVTGPDSYRTQIAGEIARDANARGADGRRLCD